MNGRVAHGRLKMEAINLLQCRAVDEAWKSRAFGDCRLDGFFHVLYVTDFDQTALSGSTSKSAEYDQMEYNYFLDVILTFDSSLKFLLHEQICQGS